MAIAVVFREVIVEVDTEEIQLLCRRLLERSAAGEDVAQDASTAIERGLPEGTVRLDDAKARTVIETIGDITTERRLIEGLRDLRDVLRTELAHDG